MSAINIANLQRLTATQLHTLLTSNPAPSLAIIDVRDSDYIGGHIKSSQHMPSGSLDAHLPELVRTLRDTKSVVFHCMLSQQRGPGAALRYLRERERVVGAGQNVFVLEGGFSAWQQKYGEDERVTEGYDKEMWGGFDEY